MSSQTQTWKTELERLDQEVHRRPRAAEEPLRRLLGSVRRARAQDPTDADLRTLESRGRFIEAMLKIRLGHGLASEEPMQAVLTDRQLAGDHLGVAACLKILAVAAEKRQDSEVALRRFQRCFRIECAHDAPLSEQARTLMQIGIIQAIQEDGTAARTTLDLAEELLPSGNEVALGIIQTNLALLDRSCGDRTRCFERLQSAVRHLETEGLSASLVNAELELAAEEIWRQSLPDAERRLARTQAMNQQLGHPFFEPELRLVRALLHLAREQPTLADAELEQALPTATPEQRCRLLQLRAEVAESAGDLAAALRWQRGAHDLKLSLVEQRSKTRMANLRAELGVAIAHKHGDWLRQELVRAQAEVRQLSSQLDDRSCAMASAAHDINNPLSVVLLLGELANSSPESLQESASAIVEAAHHMRALVTDLLGSTSPSPSEPILRRSRTPMRPILEAADRRYSPMANVKTQSLQLTCPDGICFEGDAQAMARVVDNLLSNAIKYTPEGGTIEVHAHQQDSEVLLEVLDTGPGLSRSDLERVFFYPQRLSAQPTRGESQFGIGLVSVRRMVTAMGGRVSVENRLRGGARFAVTLTATTEPAEH